MIKQTIFMDHLFGPTVQVITYENFHALTTRYPRHRGSKQSIEERGTLCWELDQCTLKRSFS